MKARLGEYIRFSVRDIDGTATQLQSKVIRIDGDASSPYVGYELEDGTLIGDWEIEMNDVVGSMPFAKPA